MNSRKLAAKTGEFLGIDAESEFHEPISAAPSIVTDKGRSVAGACLPWPLRLADESHGERLPICCRLSSLPPRFAFFSIAAAAAIEGFGS